MTEEPTPKDVEGIVEDADWYAIRKCGGAAHGRYAVARFRPSSQNWNTINRRSLPVRLECQDDFFHHDSAVLMPDLIPFEEGPPEPRSSWRCEPDAELEALEKYHPDVGARLRSPGDSDVHSEQDERVAGLCVLSIGLKFLELNPGYKLLLAGHCDTTGSKKYNFELSALRARNVQYLLEGKRDAWVDVCMEKSKVEDYQRILLRYAGACVWGCDPGSIDDVLGPMTKQAVRNFQARYVQVFGTKIAVDGIVGRQTWSAFFDLYEAEFASVLGAKPEQMDEWRSHLRYVDDDHPYLACGELYPIDEQGRDDFYSSLNRRVEMLFYHEDALPDVSSDDSHHLVYGVHGPLDRIVPVMCGSDPIPDGMEGAFSIDSFEVEQLDEDEVETELEAVHSDDEDWGFLDDFEAYFPGYGGASERPSIGDDPTQG